MAHIPIQSRFRRTGVNLIERLGDKLGVDVLLVLVESQEEGVFGDTIDETRDGARGLNDGLDGIREKEFGGASGSFESIEDVLTHLIAIPALEAETEGDSVRGLRARRGAEWTRFADDRRAGARDRRAHRHRNWS